MKELREKELVRENPPLRSKGYGRTVAAFAIGATAGSVLALLFAPASGKVTRRRLFQQVKNTQRAIGRKLGVATKTLMKKAEYAREAAGEWITSHVGNGHPRPTRRHSVHHA